MQRVTGRSTALALLAVAAMALCITVTAGSNRDATPRADASVGTMDPSVRVAAVVADKPAAAGESRWIPWVAVLTTLAVATIAVASTRRGGSVFRSVLAVPTAWRRRGPPRLLSY